MTKQLHGVWVVLLVGLLWTGCGEEGTVCESDDIPANQACETAADCPSCDGICEGNGFEPAGDPQCREEVAIGLQCVCPCQICYDRGSGPE